MKPYISIIIPTTRIGGLDITFAGLKQQIFQDFELILVDTLYEKRKELVKEKSNEYGLQVKHILQQEGATRYCSAMNSGLVIADGNILYCIGDYTWLEPHCLAKHAEFHKNKTGKYAMAGNFVEYMLPALHKDFYRPYASDVPYIVEEIPNRFVMKEKENFENYVADLNEGKLDALMWSIFETPYKYTDNPLLLVVSNVKEQRPDGITTTNHCFLKNESFDMDMVFEINGFNEALDGSHAWTDWEFIDRMITLTNTLPYYRSDAITYTVNPRTVLYGRKRERDVFSNEGIWKAGKASNFATRVNNWSILEARAAQ
jgi:glycosyltransferase involved in cell wall biosynthesis